MRTFSPGIHPISMSFSNRSLFSHDTIRTVLPCLTSDSLVMYIFFAGSPYSWLTITNVASRSDINSSSMPKSSPAIRFHFLSSCTLRDRTRLKTFLHKRIKQQKRNLVNLDIVLCSDDYLLQINKKFLNHGDYTDIITFDLAEPGDSRALQGEIYIS